MFSFGVFQISTAKMSDLLFTNQTENVNPIYLTNHLQNQ